jgi:hypothetical protein
MRTIAIVIALFAVCPVIAQQPTRSKPPALMRGLSILHHPVSTKNAEAQQFFDQGLRLVYAFNHEEAARSFNHAAELDPQLAMAWWGVALAWVPTTICPSIPSARPWQFKP